MVTCRWNKYHYIRYRLKKRGNQDHIFFVYRGLQTALNVCSSTTRLEPTPEQ